MLFLYFSGMTYVFHLAVLLSDPGYLDSEKYHIEIPEDDPEKVPR